MHFTIRVYGIYIEAGKVLVSDEYIYGMHVTKFPGGGLCFGEGTLDCLKREMIEETNQEVEVLEHFYTTDFFVPSAFDPTKQVISIYYVVAPVTRQKITVSEKKFDFPDERNGNQKFRWVDIVTLEPEEFTFPTDQKVSLLIKSKIK